jgi:hypothetical protein
VKEKEISMYRYGGEPFVNQEKKREGERGEQGRIAGT